MASPANSSEVAIDCDGSDIQSRGIDLPDRGEPVSLGDRIASGNRGDVGPRRRCDACQVDRLQLLPRGVGTVHVSSIKREDRIHVAAGQDRLAEGHCHIVAINVLILDLSRSDQRSRKSSSLQHFGDCGISKRLSSANISPSTRRRANRLNLLKKTGKKSTGHDETPQWAIRRIQQKSCSFPPIEPHPTARPKFSKIPSYPTRSEAPASSDLCPLQKSKAPCVLTEEQSRADSLGLQPA